MEDPMVDEREELVVSPLGGIPQQRKSHFLKPIVSSLEGPNLKLPSLPFSSESELPLDVTFHGCNGWRDQPKKWKRWVEMMEFVHHRVWKAAGIYEAVMSSIYRVHTDKKLIFGLVERWCCESNTFVFPWGEATVTLEDMMILGGFSVLGDLVLSPLQSRELVVIQENLEKSLKDLTGLKANNHTRWLNFFMNSGRDYEHEAFLSLWLSKFVFPGKIGAHVFSIAVNLARGMRLALAPAVLASIYRDLGLLKQAMIMASSKVSNGNRDKFDVLKLWSPLFFVQVWAWERLVSLQQEQAQNDNMVSGVRIGRWHNVKQSGVINVRTTIDSSGELFQWRPYALAVEGWLLPKFYKEKEEWTIVEGKNLDLEMESFIRCLRVSELVGFDCQEPYRPNRVAMQFGYDQDFPKWIPHSSSSPEVAWINYSRPIDSGLRLYYPARLFEPDVTTQYLKWWKKEILFLADSFKGLSQGRRSNRRLKRLSNDGVKTNRDVSDVLPDAPPGFLNHHAVGPGFPKYPVVPPGFPKQVENYPDAPPGFPNHPAVPPGFSPKLKQVKVETDWDVCDVPPGFSPRLKQKHTADGSSSVPKCNRENDKENISMEVCQTVACNVVPSGSAGKHTDGEDESYRKIARDLIDQCNDLIMEIELQLSELKR